MGGVKAVQKNGVSVCNESRWFGNDSVVILLVELPVQEDVTGFLLFYFERTEY